MGTIFDPLTATLFGKTRRALLAVLFSRPDESFYLRELVRASGSGPGAVQRELRQLERAGIVRRWTRGRQVFFQADASCPVYAELRGLILKTIGLVNVLRAALAPLGERIRWAFVYGSFADGRQHRASDVDLCVIGGVGFGEVVGAVQSAEATLGREVNPTVYSSEEFRRKLAEWHPFVSNIAGGPTIMLIGDSDEFAGMARERVADSTSAHSAGDRRPAGGRRSRSG
ncbi:MAG TPA: nucleotidyltransferase domain-containing protein [Phycisphaerae bacterium]